MASPLSDLDELVLKCRDEKSRSYIKEAVGCYRAGAFRSAIVSTWIAVTFDLIDKIRELSLTGDREASDQLTAFERARASNDISTSLKFEKDILIISRDKLEFFSHIEYIDLERLQLDRNRCAHPTMVSEEEIFSPSAELARLHIRSAVEHLLQYPPSQGKNALTRLMSEVDSDYFPLSVNQAVTNLEKSPLFRARETLIRSFLMVLVKEYFVDNASSTRKRKLITVLEAVSKIHREVYLKTFNEKILSYIRSLDDSNTVEILNFITTLESGWSFLDKDVEQKLKNCINNLPSDYVDYLEDYYRHPHLQKNVEFRARRLTLTEIAKAAFFDTPEPVLDRMVTLYTSAGSFDEANRIARGIYFYLPQLSKRQIYDLISRIGKNDQVTGSFELKTIADAIKKRPDYENDEEMAGWIQDAGLEGYFEIDE